MPIVSKSGSLNLLEEICSLTLALDEGGWLTPRPGRFTLGNDPVRIVQEAAWAPGPVWTGAENLAATGIRSPDRPARSKSQYRLSYRGMHVQASQQYFMQFILTASSSAILRAVFLHTSYFVLVPKDTSLKITVTTSRSPLFHVKQFPLLGDSSCVT